MSSPQDSQVAAQNTKEVTEVLNVYNKYCQEVNISPLKQSTNLVNKGQQWVSSLPSRRGNLQHTHNTREGKNL
ncbi:hypothetical protein [Trichormus azollae]|uniref:hypothetical protein n=1 Tax=Trichormus azollae TaxID=1164 RepID=UPI00325DAD8E